MSRLPNLLCLGTQKGGTSTLNHMLRLHEKLFLPAKKEIHYFTENWNKSLGWYEKHYENKLENQIGVDITPYYLFHPKAARRIKRTIPNVKMIILLRNPVERTISHYFHACRMGYEILPIEIALKEEEKRINENYIFSHQKHSYIGRSKYIEQIDRFEKLFAKENILVMKSEELFSQPNRIWKKVEAFMNISKQDFPKSIKRANSGNGESTSVSEKTRRELNRIFRSTSEEVEKRYGFNWN